MKWLSICSILAASSAFALVEQNIDEKHPIEVTFSTHTHNRISIENGGVEKIFGDSSIFSVNIDSATGNAFVHVLKEIDDKAAALTIVTASGAVQDLLVRSNDGPSQQIWLKEIEGEEWTIRPILSHASSIEFLNQILEGGIPSGYGERDWEVGEELDLPEPLLVKKMKAMEGPFETLCVYQIQNPDYKTVVIDPEVLKKENNSWVYLNVKELKMGMGTICIIGKAKDQNEK